mmetsp:Transcript_162606/g.521292  ORF Transcript_162606/g.521292 Transcript_162606/m.521292 type:complete len:286 (+) Transcript_162606:684-1541(+)
MPASRRASLIGVATLRSLAPTLPAEIGRSVSWNRPARRKLARVPSMVLSSSTWPTSSSETGSPWPPLGTTCRRWGAASRMCWTREVALQSRSPATAAPAPPWSPPLACSRMRWPRPPWPSPARARRRAGSCWTCSEALASRIRSWTTCSTLAGALVSSACGSPPPKSQSIGRTGTPATTTPTWWSSAEASRVSAPPSRPRRPVPGSPSSRRSRRWAATPPRPRAASTPATRGCRKPTAWTTTGGSSSATPTSLPRAASPTSAVSARSPTRARRPSIGSWMSSAYL